MRRCPPSGSRTRRDSCCPCIRRTASFTVRSIPARRERGAGRPISTVYAQRFDGLRGMAKKLLEQKRHVIMFVGGQATLVMPDETLSLGAMTANDNFRIEPAFGPNGPTWRATKI